MQLFQILGLGLGLRPCFALRPERCENLASISVFQVVRPHVLCITLMCVVGWYDLLLPQP